MGNFVGPGTKAAVMKFWHICFLRNYCFSFFESLSRCFLCCLCCLCLTHKACDVFIVSRSTRRGPRHERATQDNRHQCRRLYVSCHVRSASIPVAAVGEDAALVR